MAPRKLQRYATLPKKVFSNYKCSKSYETSLAFGAASGCSLQLAEGTSYTITLGVLASHHAVVGMGQHAKS